MVVAGEDDELSPLHNTLELLRLIPAPTWLAVYQGERRGSPASAFGPNRGHIVAQWLADRFAGQPAADRFSSVDVTGKVSDREPVWRTAATS